MAKGKKLGFIGSGNMAGAIIKGIFESGAGEKMQVLVSDTDQDKLSALEKAYGVQACSSNTDLVRTADVVILSVKPQVLPDVLEEIGKEVREEHLIISVAAGIPIQKIRDGLGKAVPVIRVMPNTPALVQKGMSAIAAGEGVDSGHLDTAKTLFASVGETVFVDEAMMDAVTAVSGSGPGFVFRIMECFVRAGREVGFDEATATKLVLATFAGAAELAVTSEKGLAELRDMVTSPGGTTAAGLGALEEQKLEHVIEACVKAAKQRGEELGKG
jgi:pyrroline-5-carboxylate reductase